VAGCLLQCVVLLLQRAGIAVPWLVFPPAPGVAPTGSLAQGNHQADYLWLGVASTLYLMARAGRLSVSGIAMVLGIAMMSVLPASRSVLLYPLGLALAAMVMWRANRRVALWRYLALLCLATLPLMLVADRLGTMMASSPASDPHTLTERLAATGGERVRAGMYQVALEETMTRPIVGHGLGAAPWVTFQRADRWPDGATPVVAEHIHNVVLQWLLEFGVPLTVVALALLAHWLRRTLQETNNPTHWWGLALLMVVAVHSQLEYPLWLTYFLLPASWLMGALAPVGTILAPARRHHAAITVAMLLELATIGDLWRDYRELERVQAAGSDPRQVPQAVQAALELDRTSLLAPNALLYLVARMESDGNAGDAHWALCSQALHVSPRTDIVTKCAAVARVTGRSEEANRLTLLLDSLSRQ
jgi:O-antigen ligase